MFNSLDSVSSSPSSSPGRRQCIVFFARHFTLAVPFFTQVYKWVPGNLTLGVTHPGKGRNIILAASYLRNRETRIRSSLMGHLARMQTYPECNSETSNI